MIRVLHLTGSCAVGDGVAASLLSLYRQMDRRSLSFDFLTFFQSKPDYEEELRALGGRVFRLSPPATPLPWELLQAMRRFFEGHRGEYQVAHCHVPAFCGVFLSAAQNAGVPLRVLHSHSTAWSSGGWRTSLRNRLMTRAGQHAANARLACSNEAATFLFGKNSGAWILPPAIEPGRFSFRADVRETMRNALGLRGRFVIGHVGRFTPEKNQAFLLDAFMALHLRFPGSVLLLVGDGPERARLQCACNKMGLKEAVRFLGVCRNVAPLLQAMDVFVFPSLFEGFGAALLEAQAAGLPCIVSSAVPHAAFVSDAVTALPLNRSASEWAEQIFSAGKRRFAPDLKNAGFEAAAAAGRLFRFYTEGLAGKRTP